MGGFGDLFGGLFNRGGAGAPGSGRIRAQKGADLETEVRIGFAEAVNGVTVPLGLTERATCPTCHGIGAKPGTSPRECPVCHGDRPDHPQPGLVRVLRTVRELPRDRFDHRRPVPHLSR